jgi:hypothetical protein
MYGKVLAKRIITDYNNIESCELGEVQEQTSAKYRWFTVSVKVKNRKMLQSSYN